MTRTNGIAHERPADKLQVYAGTLAAPHGDVGPLSSRSLMGECESRDYGWWLKSPVLLFNTKSAPRISRKPFDLDTPHFIGTFILTLSTAIPDMTSLSTSGRNL